jgi:O-antigen ligase
MLTRQFVDTTKVMNGIFFAFLFTYPLLFLKTNEGNQIDSWHTLRFYALVLIFLVTILTIFRTKLPKALASFLLLNSFFVFVTLFNPTEDNFIYNLYGTNDRQDGIIYQTLLLFFILFCYSVVKNLKDFSLIYFTLVVSGFVQSILLVAQYYQLNLGAIEIFIPTKGFSISGFIGNSGLVGGFFIAIIILNIYLTNCKIKIISSLSVIILPFICLGTSIVQTRSTLLAFFITITIYMIVNRSNNKMVIVSIATAFMILFGSSVIPQSNTDLDNRNLVSTTSIAARTDIWYIAIKLLPQSWQFPFWGGGTGELKRLISDKLPPKDLFKFYELEQKWQPATDIKSYKVLSDVKTPKRDKMYFVTWKNGKSAASIITLDKAHNFFLDKAFSIGLVGAILWMLFYLYPIYNFLRLPKHQQTPELTVLTLTLLAIQIYYLFWFSVMQVEPIHVILAIATWVALDRAKAIPDPATQGLSSNVTPAPQSLEV